MFTCSRSLSASVILPLLLLLMPNIAPSETLRILTDEQQMNIDLKASSVKPLESGGYNIHLKMRPDNGGHPDLGYLRWWHVKLAGFDPAEPTPIRVVISNAGYDDTILPVWSLDGGEYVRLPSEAVPETFPQPGGLSRHIFSTTVPAGVREVRLSKYFPYTISDKNAWLEQIASHDAVSISVTGRSHEGRAIERVDITDGSTPDSQKDRVYIHSMVHPAESTSAFLLEGMVEFLLSDDPRAKAIQEHVILNIVPMINPDGVAAGNYRTNTNTEFNPYGTNLEDEWEHPWKPREPEAIAIADDVARFMGTAEEPAPNPIRILLNLHAAHDPMPFHFLHLPLWQKDGDPGVTQEVTDLELSWIAAMRDRSRFVALGEDQESHMLRGNKRPYIEAMMFDRWSNMAAWREPPNSQPPVMAITFEGTYEMGPDGDWNTPDDYREVGRAMALAIGDFLNVWEKAGVKP